MNFLNFDLQRTLYILPGILVGLTIHECCHALAALKLGDTTARDQGRITLNPIKHIDIMGFVFIILVGFGWAKPVQFDPYNLRNYRRDKAIIAAAGPLSNLVLGILLILCVRMIVLHANLETFNEHLFMVLLYAAHINFVLFVFNLLPIPPLDGSHIVFSCLNLKPEIEYRISQFGMPALFCILLAQSFLNVTILPIGRIAAALTNFFLF